MQYSISTHSSLWKKTSIPESNERKREERKTKKKKKKHEFGLSLVHTSIQTIDDSMIIVTKEQKHVRRYSTFIFHQQLLAWTKRKSSKRKGKAYSRDQPVMFFLSYTFLDRKREEEEDDETDLEVDFLFFFEKRLFCQY